MGENLGAKLVSKCFSTAVVHRGFLSRYLGRKSDLTDARARTFPANPAMSLVPDTLAEGRSNFSKPSASSWELLCHLDITIA